MKPLQIKVVEADNGFMVEWELPYRRPHFCASLDELPGYLSLAIRKFQQDRLAGETERERKIEADLNMMRQFTGVPLPTS